MPPKLFKNSGSETIPSQTYVEKLKSLEHHSDGANFPEGHARDGE